MKISLAFLFAFIYGIGIAQNTVSKNEFGLNLYGNDIYIPSNISPESNHEFILNGIQYKHSIGTNKNLRIGFQYANENTIRNNSFLYDISSTQKSIFDSKLGFEYVFLKSKLKPFVFADMVYRYQNEKSGFKFRSNGSEGKSDYTYNNLGANFGVGLKYYPTNFIYISAETSIGAYREIFSKYSDVHNQLFISPIKTIVFGIRF